MNTESLIRYSQDYTRRYTAADAALQERINTEYKRQIDDTIAAHKAYWNCGTWDPAYNYIRELNSVRESVGKVTSALSEVHLDNVALDRIARHCKPYSTGNQAHMFSGPDLSSAFDTIKRFAARRSSAKRMEYVQHSVYVSSVTRPGYLEIRATNLSSMIRAYASYSGPLLDCLIDGDSAAEVLTFFDGSLNALHYGDKLALYDGRFTANLKTFNGFTADFPTMRDIPAAFTSLFGGKSFKAELSTALKGIYKGKNSRTALECVRFEFTSGTVRFVSCDSVRLTTTSDSTAPDGKASTFMLDHEDVKLLVKALPDSGPIDISEDKDFVFFSWGRWAIEIKKSDSVFPVYEQITPTVFDGIADLDLDAVIMAAKLFKKSEAVRLSTDNFSHNDVLHTSTLTLSDNSTEAPVPAAFDTRFDLKFDAKLFNDSLAELSKASAKPTKKQHFTRTLTVKLAGTKLLLEHAGKQVLILAKYEEAA